MSRSSDKVWDEETIGAFVKRIFEDPRFGWEEKCDQIYSRVAAVVEREATDALIHRYAFGAYWAQRESEEQDGSGDRTRARRCPQPLESSDELPRLVVRHV